MGHSSTDADSYMRKYMRQCTAVICEDAGFDYIQPFALEILNQMMICYLSESCRAAKALSEHGRRTNVNPTDVITALYEMGADIESYTSYLKKIKFIGFPVLPPKCRPNTPSQQLFQSENERKPSDASGFSLKVGKKRQMHPNIPSFLPPLPDPRFYAGRKLPSITETKRLYESKEKRVPKIVWPKYMPSFSFFVAAYPSYAKKPRYEIRPIELSEEDGKIFNGFVKNPYLEACVMDDVNMSLEETVCGEMPSF